MAALGCNINFLIPILREKEFEIVSYVMGCHDYKNIWKLPMKEKLETRMEPDNIMDNFTVTVVRQWEIKWDSGGAYNERENWKIRRKRILLLES